MLLKNGRRPAEDFEDENEHEGRGRPQSTLRDIRKLPGFALFSRSPQKNFQHFAINRQTIAMGWM